MAISNFFFVGEMSNESGRLLSEQCLGFTLVLPFPAGLGLSRQTSTRRKLIQEKLFLKNLLDLAS